MVHVDLYRLLDHGAVDLTAELDSLDLDTDLDDAVAVVEWGGPGRTALRESPAGAAATAARHRDPHRELAVEPAVTRIILAIDTSTPAVIAAVLRRDDDGRIGPLAERITVDARAHAELLTPMSLRPLPMRGSR